MAKLVQILKGKFFKWRILFLAELLPFILIPVFVIPISVHANPGEDFTIVVLPDTQYYSEMFPDIFYDQTQWIVDNKDSLNIVYVVHLGDMVENAWDEAEWLNADAAMSLLEDPVLTFLQDGIPYGVLPGNHDEPTSLYNQYFGVDRFQGRSYYGGSYSSTDNENNFTLFSAGGMDFIVINLAYGLYPGADVLNWADNVLKDWPERRAIVVAHSLIRYGEQSAFTYDGSAAYEALKDNPNLFLMLGGHMSSEGIRTDVYNGNTVYSILSNYQIFPNGGDGWLRIMKFSPTSDEITFKTYSPWLDSYGQDTVMGLGTTSQDFNLLYDMDEVSIDPPTVVIFQQSIDGYYDAVDTVILEDEADLSHGNNVLVGWDSDYPYGTGQPKYGLIRFDNIFGDGVGQIPVGATIHSATLTYVVDNPGDPADLHEVAIEWQEDATYDTFGSFAGVQTEDYGIYVGSAVGSLTGAKVIDVTDSLAAWAANPSANRGWIFLPTGTDGIDFWTSEHGTINDRPSLTVEYFPPMGTEPPTEPIALSVIASSSSQIDLSWTDTSDNESAFEIEWSTDGGITFGLLATVPPDFEDHIHEGLYPETEYCYRVRAVNAAGASAYTTVECDTTLEAQVTTVEVRVAAGSDDAEEKYSGNLTLGSSDLELVYDGGGNQIVGLRFVGVDIPQGASIVNAYVQFKVDEASSVATSLTIEGQDIDDAPIIRKITWNLSDRTRTATAVLWPAVAAWTTVGEAGPDQRTPDVSWIVEEIVSRPGWTSGNSLMLIITGSGERVAESYNGDAAGAPLLHVEYTTGLPVNQGPAVDAGADQAITFPDDTVSLDATVTDDGLPNPPGYVSAAWSQVSGPGTVIFGDETAVDTSATFVEAGTYVLQLMADDGALTASDEVTITVYSEPFNQGPAVDAGADQAITFPDDTVSLDATVTDDGLPNPPGYVSAAWSQVSGPGTVIFGDETAVDTSATFVEAGTYVLQLMADDGALTASDEVTITVYSEPFNQGPAVDAGADQAITFPDDTVSLDATVTDDGLPNPPGYVSAAWSQVSGPGTVIFGDETAVDTSATFVEAGTYVLQLMADDGALTASDEVTITVEEEGAQVTTVEVRVAAGSDDAEEKYSGNLTLGSSDLELVYDGGGNQIVGLRFVGVDIPQGASIVNAYVQFKVDEASSVATSLTIEGQDIDDAPIIRKITWNLSDRTRTATAVLWPAVAAWTTVGEAGPDQRTPDVSWIVEEIVSRPGWTSGNSLMLIITGSGERVAESYNGDAAGAPLLHVEYMTGS